MSDPAWGAWGLLIDESYFVDASMSQPGYVPAGIDPKRDPRSTKIIASLARDAVVYDVTDIDSLLSSGSDRDAVVAAIEADAAAYSPDFPPGNSLWLSYKGDLVWWWIIATRRDDGPTSVVYGALSERTKYKGICGGLLEGRDEISSSQEAQLARASAFFSTCRNVRADASRPPKQIHARMGKDVPFSVELRTIRLYPRVNAVRDTAGRECAVSNGVRLHRVRGHVKRTKWGNFWWHPFWRGRPDKGVVWKTYDVGPSA